jgi:hypothetical protein
MKTQVKNTLKSLTGSLGRTSLLVLSVVLATSCSKDDKETRDATAVAGTYAGELKTADGTTSFGALSLAIEATKTDSIVIKTTIDLSPVLQGLSLPVTCPAKVTFTDDHYTVSGSVEVSVPLPGSTDPVPLQVQIGGTITSGKVKTATLTITPAIPDMPMAFLYTGVKSK